MGGAGTKGAGETRPEIETISTFKRLISNGVEISMHSL
jgi:hypothetical protein